MQSMTLTLQGFVDARVNWRTSFRALWAELLTAFLIGLACGSVVGVVAWAWKRHGMVAVAIGASICLSIVTSCLLGVIIPSIVRALKIDPKFASGPVALASADVATLILYLSLSSHILHRLPG